MPDKLLQAAKAHMLVNNIDISCYVGGILSRTATNAIKQEVDHTSRVVTTSSLHQSRAALHICTSRVQGSPKETGDLRKECYYCASLYC